MDSMSIGSRILQRVLTRAIVKAVKSKIGVDADIKFNDPIRFNYDEDGGVRLHVNADVFMLQDEFDKILEKVV